MKIITVNTPTLRHAHECDESKCNTCIMRFRCLTEKWGVDINWDDFCHYSIKTGALRPPWLYNHNLNKSIEGRIKIGVEKNE